MVDPLGISDLSGMEDCDMTMALSWSRISDYRQCPHKFRLKYVDKAPNFQLKDADKNPHLVRGGNVHKQLEKYVVYKRLGQECELTMPEVIGTTPLIDSLMAHYDVHPERQIAIDSDFKQVDWYSRDAWFRVIVDLLGFGNDLLLGDYKTGKMNDYGGSMSELGQLHMTALVGFALWPEYDECSSLYIYVDHKRTHPCKFSRDEFAEMQDSLVKEHEAINADDEYVETKNQFCRWCEATYEQCKNARK